MDISECAFLKNKPEKNGYVRVGRGGPGKERLAHRRAYVEVHGPIPVGWTVDHECHNRDETCPGGAGCRHRACVNPDHLVAKPSRENTLASRTTVGSVNRAKGQCSRGHPFTEPNTYKLAGKRYCRMCKLLDHQKSHARKKAEQWGLSDVGEL